MNNFKDFLQIEKRTKYFIHALSFLCLVSIIIFTLLIIGGKSLQKGEPVTAKEFVNPFDGIALEAKGVLVWDVVNEKEIFSKNSDLPLPLASLTKVMTVLTVDQHLSNLPNTSITIKEAYLAPEGDSGLVVGDTWKVGDLRDFTLLTSSNDGAFALAAVVEPEARSQFIKAMNEKASEVGLLNSRFFNEHGLDREENKGGSYGSARDMALLFEYVIKNNPKILEATRYQNLQFRSSEKVYSASNTNASAGEIPNLLASKTGYTDLAGGNLVVAFDAGVDRPIIISVLGSSEEGRFSDTLKLVETSLKYIQEN